MTAALTTLSIAPLLAQTAVRGAWESAGICLLVALLLRTHRGFSPRSQFWVWAAGFLLAAAIPCLRLDVSRAGLPAATTAPSHASLLLAPGWGQALCLAWLLVSLLALARLALGMVSLARLVRSATPASAPVRALYRRVAAESRRAAGARVLESSAVQAPSACGLPRPTILLPTGLAEKLTSGELACVLRHEAAHLARRDDWWSLATRLTQAALPFHFALRYLDRGMARAREMVCDDAALASGISRTGYAACLARMAEQMRGNGIRGLAPGLGGDGSQLVARVRHVLESVQPMGTAAKLRVTLGGCAGVLLVGAMVTAPGLVEFRTRPLAAQLPVQQLATPTLAAAQVNATVPLERVRPAHWTAPVDAAAPPRMDVAEASPMPSPSSIRQANAILPARSFASSANSLRELWRPAVPSVYLLWRPHDASAPTGVLLVLPGSGFTPSRIFLLSI